MTFYVFFHLFNLVLVQHRHDGPNGLLRIISLSGRGDETVEVKGVSTDELWHVGQYCVMWPREKVIDDVTLAK